MKGTPQGIDNVMVQWQRLIFSTGLKRKVVDKRTVSCNWNQRVCVSFWIEWFIIWDLLFKFWMDRDDYFHSMCFLKNVHSLVSISSQAYIKWHASRHWSLFILNGSIARYLVKKKNSTHPKFSNNWRSKYVVIFEQGFTFKIIIETSLVLSDTEWIHFFVVCLNRLQSKDL